MTSASVHITSPGRQPLHIVVSAPLDVGREGNGLLLADEHISRRHCRLEAVGDGQLRITDLGSANGVVVDGQPITGPIDVPIGGSASIGDTRLEVVAGRAQPTTIRTTMATGQEIGRTTAIERVAESVRAMSAPGLVEVSEEPGTLTIVFSDIEESTEQAMAVGDLRWFEIMDHHTALMTHHVAARQGRIVRNLGDGFMMCFRSARQGLLAAIDMQRHLAKVADRKPDFAVRVRMGLHTGEVLQNDEGDLFGRHVQLAAHIGDLASGGQILVSGLLKAIAEPRGDLVFSDEMLAQLEGFDNPQAIYDVDWQASSTP